MPIAGEVAIVGTAMLTASRRAAASSDWAEDPTETVVAALTESDQRLVSEAGDLLYHLLVLLAARDIRPEAVFAELEARAG